MTSSISSSASKVGSNFATENDLSDPSAVNSGSERIEPWMKQAIIFPVIRSNESKNGPIVISATIAGLVVRGIYIAEGAETEVMYEHCFNQLDEVVRRNLTEDSSTLTGVLGGVVKPIGQIRLPVTIGAQGRFRTLEMTFLIIRANASPNIIIGRSGLRALRAVASICHGVIMFPTPNGVATMLSEEDDYDDNDNVTSA